MSLFNVVLHIGLPKTATTTLQKKLAGESYYAGNESDSQFITKDLLKIFYSYSKKRSVERDLYDWIIATKKWSNEKKIDTIFLSDEHFFSGEINGVDEFPFYLYKKEKIKRPILIDFIEFMKKIFSANNAKLKCVLTIRNQYDWLASKYAQDSRSVFFASQVDFEKRINEFLNFGDDYWCNWYIWIEEIAFVLSKENLCVLCLESIKDECFWEDLARFSSLDIKSLENKIFDNKKKAFNTKRKSDGKWELGKFNPMAFLLKSMKVFPGTKRQKLINKSGALFFKTRIYDIYRKEYIYLSEGIRKDIIKSCGESNKRLSLLLGKDIKSMGYPM